ncbi:MAG: methylmalonyl Co-A mutase-associated GTPase MeaB [Chitinophagaceae bacterium]|nr:methylmalonyl Co-A mutase-associated GTPase MeaB [Anaerolineae bacterium]
MRSLADEVLKGSRRALAQLLTVVENGSPGADEAIAALFPYTGNAWMIGITGAPGTGKSSLVNSLAKAYREQVKTVAIIAVDPTSPFSGGAILGDRIRMRDLSGDKGVFIRSMATRGNLGGLSRATRDAMRVLDAAGFNIILVETVGAGQSEVDIVRAAQTTIVVEAPGMGDDVQAIKAGILEIADILVVNKADRPGADNTVRGLRTMLELGHPAAKTHMLSHHGQLVRVEIANNQHENAFWMPPVIRTVATSEDRVVSGVDALIAAIVDHRRYIDENGLNNGLERQRIEIELYERLQSALMTRLQADVRASVLTDMIERIQARQIDPQHAVHLILETQKV